MEHIEMALSSLKKEVIKTEGIDIGLVDYPYYKHFKDTNPKFKAGSLFAFMFLLLDWNQGSGFAFKNKEDFELYLENFINCADDFKKEYPYIYLMIVVTLEELYTYKEITNKFPDFPSQLLTNLKNQIFNNATQPVYGMFPNAIKEGMREL